MRRAPVVLLALATWACGPSWDASSGPARPKGNGQPSTPSSAPLPSSDPNRDVDGDGYSFNAGDCNDTEPLIGPDSVEVEGNGIDDDCNGVVDEPTGDCDQATVSGRTAALFHHTLDLCNDKFVISAGMVGPSDERARQALPKYGMLVPQRGQALLALSTGIVGDKDNPGYVSPQPGTDLSLLGSAANEAPNPAPDLPSPMGCGTQQPATVNDYSEYMVTLKVPMNARSFSFQFQFLSTEYPEFVCRQFNDEFLVMMESQSEFPRAENIAFDMWKNPITVNNGFFTVCENDNKRPQTQHCTRPVSELGGTGYEELADPALPGLPPPNQSRGGSTGWLTTTAPVTPGEKITLRFIIFDEGDHIYDSAVLIDNFRWGTQAVSAPMTIP